MVGFPQTEVVAVLTRAPSAGGKTRLFEALGIATDPSFLAALLLDTLDGVTDGFARQVIVEPASSVGDVQAIVPPDVTVVPQREGSLGMRMRAVFETLLALGASRVVLIGSDLPTITAEPIRDAFEMLRRDPDVVVLGPAEDGGYYLIGASRVPDVFDDPEWGTASVFDQTCRAAARADLRVRCVTPISDVDNVDDLERLIRSAPASGAQRTVEWARQRRSSWRRSR